MIKDIFIFKADGVCYIIQEIYGIENKKEGSKDKVNYFLRYLQTVLYNVSCLNY